MAPRQDTVWQEAGLAHTFINDVRGGVPYATDQHRPDKVANILAPVERQCEWLRGLGFEDVDCYFKVFELAVFGGRRPPAS